MSIRFYCDCGQGLSAQDEHAGRQVRCGSCGAMQTVPEPGGSVLVGGMLRFACSCGQTCQAHPEHAGRKTRCPRCEAILAIPALVNRAPAIEDRPRDAIRTRPPDPVPLDLPDEADAV